MQALAMARRHVLDMAVAVPVQTLRRSARLQALQPVDATADSTNSKISPVASTRKRSARVNASIPAEPVEDGDATTIRRILKRTRTPVKATTDDGADEKSNANNTKKKKKKSSSHLISSRSYELAQEAKGFKWVVGVDEAGRGPLAGPVVAAACFVPSSLVLEGVADSKKLNEEQREALYEQLTSHPQVKYAVHINSAQRIDEINILQASLESMAKAVDALPIQADFVFVDGNRMPSQLSVEAQTVIQGDSKIYCIAAASIIAKVTRDRLMLDYDKQYPAYGLAQHKGYPTRAHMQAIATHGPCAIHRMTFAPLKPKEANKSASKKPKRK